MEKRTLGNGQAVSAIGLGCMGMDHAYGRPAPRDEMIRLLHHALELGCNFFDTAVVYGEANEELLGMGRFRPEVMERNQALLGLIRNMAESKQAAPAQIVLAWELAQRPFIIPIPGTTNPQRLEENLGAALIELSSEDLAAISDALAQIDVDETYF